jgi:hypothetical protein
MSGLRRRCASDDGVQLGVWLVDVCSDAVGQTIVATLLRADGVQRVLRAGIVDDR